MCSLYVELGLNVCDVLGLMWMRKLWGFAMHGVDVRCG